MIQPTPNNFLPHYFDHVRSIKNHIEVDTKDGKTLALISVKNRKTIDIKNTRVWRGFYKKTIERYDYWLAWKNTHSEDINYSLLLETNGQTISNKSTSKATKLFFKAVEASKSLQFDKVQKQIYI